MHHNLFSLATEETNYLKKIEQQLREFQSALTIQLTEVLRSIIFSNNHTLHPSSLDEISKQEIESFLLFINKNNVSMIMERGKRLAKKGMGCKSLLSIGSCILYFCSSKLDAELLPAFIKAVNIYVAALVEGFMDEFKSRLILDQVQIKHAYNAIASNN